MAQQEENIMKSGSAINVRKLAALDIVFHGPWLILAEFVLAVVVCAALGIWSFLSPIHSPFVTFIGCYLQGVALNYVPLFLYAISIVRRKSAQQEVAFELEHKDRYAAKYTLQSALLLVPFAMFILAVYQETMGEHK